MTGLDEATPADQADTTTEISWPHTVDPFTAIVRTHAFLSTLPAMEAFKQALTRPDGSLRLHDDIQGLIQQELLDMSIPEKNTFWLTTWKMVVTNQWWSMQESGSAKADLSGNEKVGREPETGDANDGGPSGPLAMTPTGLKIDKIVSSSGRGVTYKIAVFDTTNVVGEPDRERDTLFTITIAFPNATEYSSGLVDFWGDESAVSQILYSALSLDRLDPLFPFCPLNIGDFDIKLANCLTPKASKYLQTVLRELPDSGDLHADSEIRRRAEAGKFALATQYAEANRHALDENEWETLGQPDLDLIFPQRLCSFWGWSWGELPMFGNIQFCTRSS